jgi:hypothetical protein
MIITSIIIECTSVRLGIFTFISDISHHHCGARDHRSIFSLALRFRAAVIQFHLKAAE